MSAEVEVTGWRILDMRTFDTNSVLKGNIFENILIINSLMGRSSAEHVLLFERQFYFVGFTVVVIFCAFSKGTVYNLRKPTAAQTLTWLH